MCDIRLDRELFGTISIEFKTLLCLAISLTCQVSKSPSPSLEACCLIGTLLGRATKARFPSNCKKNTPLELVEFCT